MFLLFVKASSESKAALDSAGVVVELVTDTDPPAEYWSNPLHLSSTDAVVATAVFLALGGSIHADMEDMKLQVERPLRPSDILLVHALCKFQEK